MKKDKIIFYVFAAFFLALGIILFCSGCGSDFYTQSEAAKCYYVNPDKKISSLSRVAIIELQNESVYLEVAAQMSEALYNELQKRQIAGLSVVYSSDERWKKLEISTARSYEPRQLTTARKILRCDAIIVGSVVEYKPYPHLSIAVRLKMIDLTDGQVLWGYEQVWDTSDKYCQSQVRKYYRTQKNEQIGQLRQKLITASSIEFLKFVSFEVSQTL